MGLGLGPVEQPYSDKKRRVPVTGSTTVVPRTRQRLFEDLSLGNSEETEKGRARFCPGKGKENEVKCLWET